MWGWHRRSAADFSQEIQAHILLDADRLIAEGMRPADARAAARRTFGNVTQAQERFYESRRMMWLDNLQRDMRYAIRSLIKNPGLTIVAVLTLALGIGPNATMFSAVNYLLKPLPVAKPGQLTVLATTQRGNSRIFQRLAYPDYEDYKAAGGAFQDLAAWDLTEVGLMAEGRTDPLVVSVVSGNYFSMLGLVPAVGRLIDPSDDIAANPLIVVLGYAYWSRQFAADPSVVGREVRIDGRPATVIGVTPASFEGTFRLTRMDAYLPLGPMVPMSRLADRDVLSVRVLGRLQPHAGLRQAQASIDTLAVQLEQEYAATNAGRRAHVYSQRLAGVEPQYATQLPILVVMLLLLVGAVLLIAAANVLGLFLSRAVHRDRELAVRAALGASQWQLVRACLVEASLIGLAGGIVGGAAGLALARGLAAVAATPGFPIYLDLGVDWQVFSYLTILLLVSTLLIGLVPSLRASRVDPRDGLAEVRTASPSRKKQRTLTSLVTAQVAGSVTLLVICGLFVRSVANLESAELGFKGDRILLATTDPSAAGYQEGQAGSFYESVDAALEKLPGVEHVAASVFVPFGNGGSTSYVAAEGDAPPTSVTGVLADRHLVTADYFETLGTSVIRGRSFDGSDRARSSPVAVINQAMAKRLWPGENAVAKRFRETAMTESLVEVVGIVPDARYRREDVVGSVRPRFFLSLDQFFQSTRILHVRAAKTETAGLVAEIQRTIREVDSAVPVRDVFTLDYQVKFGSNGFGGTRSVAYVTGILGGLALLLALVGTYGVLSFTVSQRTREISIRMALGAVPSHVLRMVLMRIWSLTLVAILIGVGLALALGQLMTGLLVDVVPLDAKTIAAVVLVTGTVTTAVGYLSARRAMRADPLVALRCE